MQAKAISLFILACAGVTGCSVLSPYDQTFMCESSADYGHCQSVDEAYIEALGDGPATSAGPAPGPAPRVLTETGRPQGSGRPENRPSGNIAHKSPDNTGVDAPAEAPLDVARERYRARQYSELAGLIEAPVTPVLAPTDVLRTLILSYSADNTLYMSRYVFYVAAPPHFVVGDYLEQPPAPAQMIYPNGDGK